MKRFVLLILISSFLSASSYGNHITGGQIYYTLKSNVLNDYTYTVTLLLYRDSLSVNGAQLDGLAPIAIFDRVTGARITSFEASLAYIEVLHLWSPGPCITNPPAIVYQVGHYTFDITLPASLNGYIIAYQRCCRIAGINNLTSSSNTGVTYTAEIPGVNSVVSGPANNSAKFIGSDTVIVCANNAFTYSFTALDSDGDQLSYSFCNAYGGGSASSPSPNPPFGPPYTSVPYAAPFSSSSPLGPGVTLNTSTGLISGIAPVPGIYVVTVCVNEIRNGAVIATQRKDLQIKVGDCNIAKAALDPQYITCDGYTMNFFNLNNSPLIKTYYWDFDIKKPINDTSNVATPTYTYGDTGTYTIKLVTNRNQECSDSTTAIVKVYPGFFPAFTVSGACFSNPFQFTDVTNTAYGIVDSWSWSFGDPSSNTDTSHSKNPAWQYPDPGPKNVMLIVTNSKGCIDTAQQTITVIDKPVIKLAFKDTLICVPDNVQLSASGSGIFSWTPTTSMINSNTATPTVNPANTTYYVVNLNDAGCINKDSVRVRVVRFVTLAARADTVICRTDGVQLGAATDGLQFQWTPAATLNNPNIVNPLATPLVPSITYQVVARIGTCTASDDVTVMTIPYPYSNAGNDTVICYNTSAQLHGDYIGISYAWSPSSYLNDPTSINPVSTPPRTTSYIFSVRDNLGCPKPGLDTVVVTVLPKVNAFAGRDTSVVINQELQLNGSGGIGYLWSPPTGLNNPAIADPKGIYGGEDDSVRYKLLVTDQAGCSDSAFMLVKIFKTNPKVFVPTGFTPNGDGLNDFVKPIAVGIEKIIYFSVYNRWGQMVFTTTENGKGWDGRIAGKLQSSGVYVWMVSATDYIGKPFYMKGTVALIR